MSNRAPQSPRLAGPVPDSLVASFLQDSHGHSPDSLTTAHPKAQRNSIPSPPSQDQPLNPISRPNTSPESRPSTNTSSLSPDVIAKCRDLIAPLIERAARQRKPDLDAAIIEERVRKILSDGKCMEFIELAKRINSAVKRPRESEEMDTPGPSTKVLRVDEPLKNDAEEPDTEMVSVTQTVASSAIEDTVVSNTAYEPSADTGIVSTAKSVPHEAVLPDGNKAEDDPQMDQDMNNPLNEVVAVVQRPEVTQPSEVLIQLHPLDASPPVPQGVAKISAPENSDPSTSVAPENSVPPQQSPDSDPETPSAISPNHSGDKSPPLSSSPDSLESDAESERDLPAHSPNDPVSDHAPSHMIPTPTPNMQETQHHADVPKLEVTSTSPTPSPCSPAFVPVLWAAVESQLQQAISIPFYVDECTAKATKAWAHRYNEYRSDKATAGYFLTCE